MPIRSREYMEPLSGGSCIERFSRSDWDEYGSSAFTPFWRKTDDVTGVAGNGNFFSSETWQVHSGAITGIGLLADYGRTIELSNFMPYRYGANANSIRIALDGVGPNVKDSDLQYEYTQFVNQTSPARSESNLPVGLIELREVPGLIRSAKDLINVRKWLRTPMKQVSDAWLSWSFGVSPMLSDLNTILTLPDLINKRFRELKNIRDRGYKKSTRGLLQFNREPSVRTETYANSHPIRLDYKETTSCAHSAWGHVIWKCDSLKLLTDNDLRNLARTKLLDGDISINDLWELVPWSWLTDYFASTGDYLSYMGNTIPGLVDRGSVMCHTHKWLLADIIGEPVLGVKFPQVQLSYERKYRIPGSPGIYVSEFNVLSDNQLANIAAVVASSKRGYTRSD